MLRRVVSTLLAVACVLALAGCRRADSDSDSGSGGGARTGGAEGADAFASQLDSFTEELLAKVESARDAKSGLGEAQAMLDARRDELAGRIAALKRDAGSKAKLLEAEVDNTGRVHRLQLKYSDEAARDPDLKARLERLIGDYDALFREP
jgi:hypothetical protein